MSQVSKLFEFVDGTRNSKQLLYKNQLYNKHLSVHLGFNGVVFSQDVYQL